MSDNLDHELASSVADAAKKVAHEIRLSHFNAGEYSGISAVGEEKTAQALADFAGVIIQAIAKKLTAAVIK